LNKEFLKISVTNVQTKYHSVNLKIWTTDDSTEEEAPLELNDETVILSETAVTPKKLQKQPSQQDKAPVDSVIEEQTQIQQTCSKVNEEKKESQHSNHSEEMEEASSPKTPESTVVQENLVPETPEKKMDEISNKLQDLNFQKESPKEQQQEEEEDDGIFFEKILTQDSTQISEEGTQESTQMSFEEKLYLRCLAQTLTQEKISVEELQERFSITFEKSTEIIKRMIDDKFIKAKAMRKKHAVNKNKTTSGKLDEIMKLLPVITETLESSQPSGSKKRKHSALESSQDPYEFQNSKISTTIAPIEQLNKKIYRNAKKMKTNFE
jgi:hypothetical protein